MQKKQRDIGRVATKIIATVLAILMVGATVASLITYLIINMQK